MLDEKCEAGMDEMGALPWDRGEGRRSNVSGDIARVLEWKVWTL